MPEPTKLSSSSDGAWVFKGASSRTALLYAGMALLLVVALVVVGDEIGHHIRAIDSWIASLGPWGVLAFIGLFVLTTSLFVPETVLAIMAGALFGLGEGLAIVVAGGMAAGTLQFLLSRWILRDRIQKTLGAKPSLAAVQQAVMRSEVRLQVLLRLTPLNPATLSFLLGATGVRFSGFLLACLALVPNQVIEVYFGYAGKHVAKIAGRGAPTVYLHDIAVIGGLIMCIIVVVVASRMARRAVAEAVAEAGNPQSAGSGS
jgi:uncharacterized membrane protein YdjX (TVP38/TMEM64 family)